MPFRIGRRHTPGPLLACTHLLHQIIDCSSRAAFYMSQSTSLPPLPLTLPAMSSTTLRSESRRSRGRVNHCLWHKRAGAGAEAQPAPLEAPSPRSARPSVTNNSGRLSLRSCTFGARGCPASLVAPLIAPPPLHSALALAPLPPPPAPTPLPSSKIRRMAILGRGTVS